MKTYRDLYPTGRKTCALCGRFRHVFDFTVRKWADEPYCTVPHLLSSFCKTCGASWKRSRTGDKPRVWYPHGHAATEKARLHRNELNRASAKKRRQDPEYRKRQAEYDRIWRNAKTGAIARLTIDTKKPPLVDRDYVPANPFLEWFDKMHAQATATEVRYIGLARNQEREEQGSGRIEADIVDAVMSRYGAQDQFNILYPEQ